MNTNRKSRAVWFKAAVSSIAVAALSLSVGVLPASAADELGNIDTTKTGSITLHKHEYTGNDQTKKQRPDGSSAALKNPVPGVVFTAYKLDLDLTKNTDWDTLSKLTVGSGVCDTNPITVGGVSATKYQDFAATIADGTTSLSGVPLGAYLICETGSPASIIEKAQPFVISVPFPDNIADDPAATKTWIYDVHAYPKNALTQIDKTVVEQGDLGLGSTVSFPVTAGIPAIGADSTFKQFEIRDTLDSKLGSVKVDSVQVVATDGTKTAIDAANYSSSVTGNDARVVFNAAGLTWLKSQAGLNIEVVFSGVVTTLGADGVITNQAFLHAGTTLAENDPIPTPNVKQNWGDVVIKKVDDQSTPAPLKDAAFEVYEASEAYPQSGNCTDTTIPTGATPISVTSNGTAQTEFTTGDDGTVKIAGLFVSDSVNPAVNSTFRCYVVKETKAPAGFVTPTGDAALHAVAVKAGVNATGVIDLTVTNSKPPVPELPLTGSAGTILIILAGVALIGGSIFLMVKYQQKVTKDSTTNSQ